MLKKSDHVMMSPYRLPVAVADGLRDIAQQRGCSMTHIVREAIVEWYARRGIVDPQTAIEVERQDALKKDREAREAAAREQAVRDAEKRLIDHLEHWRRHGGGKPYPYLAGRTCPPGFEDVIRGTVNREEEI